MRKAAFYLVAWVIGFQLVLLASTLAGCFFMPQKNCTGEKIANGLDAIMAQVFALYASEK